MQQGTTTPPPNPPAQQATQGKAESPRTFWVYTLYVAAALVLLGLLAYHFAGQILK